MLIERLPATLPPWSAILADVCNPPPDRLAAVLDVHPRTLARWLAADQAPRCAALALWPLTRWGMSGAEVAAWNQAQLDAARRLAAEVDAEALRCELARVIAAGDFGCANDASRSTRPRPWLAVRA